MIKPDNQFCREAILLQPIKNLNITIQVFLKVGSYALVYLNKRALIVPSISFNLVNARLASSLCTSMTT